MRRFVLAALLAGALLPAAGCGGDSAGSTKDPASQVPTKNGLQAKVRAAQAVNASDFPSASGKTLQQLASEVKGGGGVEAGLASSVFTVGQSRFAFGVIDQQGQFVYGPSAVYIAPDPNKPAQGPFPAPADVLLTQPRYRSQQAATEADPFAAVYEANVRFPRKGPYAVLVVTKDGDHLVAAPSQVQVTTKKADTIPEVGDAPPKVATDTIASVKGDEKLLDTRVPPSDMHKDSFDQILGKKPVALLFSTPQLCQSRVCGPVTDIAEQLKAKYGGKIEFIHQEVYANNDPKAGLRPPLQAFHLRTEPWLFVVNAKGRITARLEGSFGINAFENAVKTAL
jgi:hypothetical protein